VRAPTAYRHGVGHVALGCHTNVDIAACANPIDDRCIEIARQVVRDRETGRAEISPEAAGLLADVLSRVDDWDEVRALTKLLRAASEYDGTQTEEVGK
jgi:hypothetical protein